MSGQQITLEGEPKQELILSAHVGDNSKVFPKVLELHVDDDARIADVTHGPGVFWKRVDKSRYSLELSDINPERSPKGKSIDCRDLPYENNSLDAVVFDPPYSEGFTRSRDESRRSFLGRYSHDGEWSDLSHHEAIVELYRQGAREAARVLKPDGVYIVKCQDEVSANRNRFTHIELVDEFSSFGFDLIDLFVVIRTNAPNVTGVENQVHARKNHSYFEIFRLDAEPGGVGEK